MSKMSRPVVSTCDKSAFGDSWLNLYSQLISDVHINNNIDMSASAKIH